MAVKIGHGEGGRADARDHFQRTGGAAPRRATRGDRRAFTAVYERHHQGLYRYCLGIVGNPEDARDALQNTMVKALGGLSSQREPGALKAWLYRIAHNESITLLRKRPATEALPEELPASVASVEATAETRERLTQLVSDLGALPERQRGALIMRELNDLDYDEIAGALETSAAAAKQAVYDARMALSHQAAGRALDCGVVRRAISDADGRVLRARKLRAHLVACAACEAFRVAIPARREQLAHAFPPLPAASAATVLKAVLAGGAAKTAGAGGLFGIGGSLGSSTLLAGASAVVIAAGGVSVGVAKGLSGAEAQTRASQGAANQAGDAKPAGAHGDTGAPTTAETAAAAAAGGLGAGPGGAGASGAGLGATQRKARRNKRTRRTRSSPRGQPATVAPLPLPIPAVLPVAVAPSAAPAKKEAERRTSREESEPAPEEVYAAETQPCPQQGLPSVGLPPGVPPPVALPTDVSAPVSAAGVLSDVQLLTIALPEGNTVAVGGLPDPVVPTAGSPDAVLPGVEDGVIDPVLCDVEGDLDDIANGNIGDVTDLPDIDLPDNDLPDVDLPEVDVPEVDADVDVPEVSDLPRVADDDDRDDDDHEDRDDGDIDSDDLPGGLDLGGD